MFPVFNVSFLFLKLINTLVLQVDLQRFRPEFRAFRSIMRQNCWPQKQPFMTLRDTHARTHAQIHTKLCYFNNGVCYGYGSKTKFRPASITISFKLFPHKNNTLV